MIVMISAEYDAPSSLIVAYSAVVDVGDFNTGDFATVPNGFEPTSISTVDPSTIYLDFLEPLGTQTDLTYLGSADNFESPQTIEIT
jgi:hypothetical protein